MPIQTWTAREWAEFDNVDEGVFEPSAPNDVPIEVDDPEGDPMGLSDISEEGVDYDMSASRDEQNIEDWRIKR